MRREKVFLIHNQTNVELKRPASSLVMLKVGYGEEVVLMDSLPFFLFFYLFFYFRQPATPASYVAVGSG